MLSFFPHVIIGSIPHNSLITHHPSLQSIYPLSLSLPPSFSLPPSTSSLSIITTIIITKIITHSLLITTVDLKAKTGPKLKDFRDYVNTNQVPEIDALREDVEAFSKQFPTIGFEKATMRYQE